MDQLVAARALGHRPDCVEDDDLPLAVEVHGARAAYAPEDANDEVAGLPATDLLEERIPRGPRDLDRPVAGRHGHRIADRGRRVEVRVVPAAAFELLTVRAGKPVQQLLRRRPAG